MTDNELQICERLKEVRKSLNMKQGEFAKGIKTTQGHVSDIENKRKGVSDRVIEIICLKYGICEEWLRYGIEPMKKTHEDDVAECVEDLLSTDNPFYDIIKSIMITYRKLDDKSQKIIENFSEELAEELVKRTKKDD